MMEEEDDDFVTPYVGKRSKSRLKKKRKLPPIESRSGTSRSKIEVRVEVIAGLHAGEFRRLKCESGEAIDCGRSKKRKLSFPRDFSVSETHAVIYIEPQEDNSTVGFCICDRNSTNGTRLNGKQLRAGIDTASDLPIHSVELGDTCFQVTLKIISDDDNEEEEKNVDEVQDQTISKKTCFVCGMSLDHLTDAALQVHVNQCLDNQERAKNMAPPPPVTTTTTTTTTTSTERSCPFCSITFGSVTDLLQHIKPCAATKNISNEKLFEEIRKIRSDLGGMRKRKHSDVVSTKKKKRKKKKSKPLVETPRLGRKAKLAAKKDPELALALALSVSMECLDALPTEELESRLSTLQTQISNLQDRAAVLHEILQRRRDLSEEKARLYEKKRSDELAVRRVALIDPSKAAQSLFGNGGMDEAIDPSKGLFDDITMDDEEEEEEEEKVQEESDLTETKGRSRREAGLSLWNMTACAGDDDLDGVALTQSKFRTTSLLNENTKEKDVGSETKDDDDDVGEEEKEDDDVVGEEESNDEKENVNDSIIALDDDDDDNSVGEEEKVGEYADLSNDEKVEIETKEDDVEIETKEDDIEIEMKEDDSIIALDDDDDDLDVVEEKKEKKKDDSIIDLTQQQQQPSDDNDDSHIFDTQRDDMREMLLGIADVDSDLPSTQKTNKTSSFSFEEYDHIEDYAPIGVVTGGNVQNDDIIVLSDDDDDDDSKKKTQTKTSSKPTKSKIAASRQKSNAT